MNQPLIIPKRTTAELQAALNPNPGSRNLFSNSEFTKIDEDEPYARTLDEFVRHSGDDPDELIKHRYLCRKGGLLLVGPTGHGKSSLAMQLMIKWALGQTVFGLEPTRPLKSLLIQAENDDGDLAEMKIGVFNGLNLSVEDQTAASANVLVSQETSKTGPMLCHEVLAPLLKTIKPDLLWIDPALAYLGGDMNNQKDVGVFLRNHLAPLIAKYNCAVIIVHHTNKISKDPDKQMTDFTYMGAGSAEWANWSRAILALNKTDVDNLYELIAAKRGARLRWRTADGVNLTMTRYIGHSKRPETICWVEMAIADAEDLRATKEKTAENVLKNVPQNALIAKDQLTSICQRQGIGKNKIPILINELVEGKVLFEHRASREGKVPKILLGREPMKQGESHMLDQYVHDSNGHYLPPVKIVQIKKEL